jgi:hypothetical protein
VDAFFPGLRAATLGPPAFFDVPRQKGKSSRYVST